ncbi:RDD family protein [Parvibaculum sp.]|uniref:RDD family protein n=1 Tax=Parvibaculum sp. TaxID=2024848 RepID=UPI00391CCEB3
MRESNRLAEIWPPDSEDAVWPDSTFDGIIIARCLAFIADLAVILVLLIAASLVFGILGILSFGLLWPGAALTPLLVIAYFTFTLGGRYSATPGMRWQGIELRAWNGNRPGYLQAFLQTLLFYVTVTVGTVLVLLVPFFNKRRRCLHDYLCGTVFIRSGI